MHRDTEQQGFVDHLLGPGRSRSDEFFRSVDRVVNWSLLQNELKDIHVSKMGAPSFQPLMLFKALLIQRWYDLSDPATEDALNDRKSFARFVGLPLEAKAPDHTTLWRFRELLIKRGLMEPLLSVLMAQIETAGLILKEGTLLDATFVPSAVRPPSAPRDVKQPKTQESEGETSDPVTPQGEDQPIDPPASVPGSIRPPRGPRRARRLTSASNCTLPSIRSSASSAPTKSWPPTSTTA